MFQRGLLVGLLMALAACGAKPAGGPNMSVILADAPAPILADYGLFEDTGADQPIDGVIAYTLTNPLFTDYAAKHRFVFVPDGEAAAYNETDVFDFPVGTVLVKTFGYAPDMRAPDEGAYKLETRLLIRKADGWVAVPYVWNEAQTEARYAPIGAKLEVETVSPAGCAAQVSPMACPMPISARPVISPAMISRRLAQALVISAMTISLVIGQRAAF